MNIKLPELIDRISIARLKVERVGEPQCSEELEAYEKALEEFKQKGVEIKDRWINELYEANKKLWDLEWDVRVIADSENPFEEAEKFGLSKLGERAVKVWAANGQRVAIKNRIAKETGEGFEEKKIDHAAGKQLENE